MLCHISIPFVFNPLESSTPCSSDSQDLSPFSLDLTHDLPFLPWSDSFSLSFQPYLTLLIWFFLSSPIQPTDLTRSFLLIQPYWSVAFVAPPFNPTDLSRSFLPYSTLLIWLFLSSPIQPYWSDSFVSPPLNPAHLSRSFLPPLNPTDLTLSFLPHSTLLIRRSFLPPLNPTDLTLSFNTTDLPSHLRLPGLP